MNVDQIK